MRSVFVIAAICAALLVAPAFAAPPAEPASFNGTWRFDGERTRELLGETEASRVLAEDPTCRAEIKVPDEGAGYLRVYCGRDKKSEHNNNVITKAEIVGDSLTLHSGERKQLPLQIQDADTLIAREGGRAGVLVRVLPGKE